jgi:hypothetical protein
MKKSANAVANPLIPPDTATDTPIHDVPDVGRGGVHAPAGRTTAVRSTADPTDDSFSGARLRDLLDGNPGFLESDWIAAISAAHADFVPKDNSSGTWAFVLRAAIHSLLIGWWTDVKWSSSPAEKRRGS